MSDRRKQLPLVRTHSSHALDQADNAQFNSGKHWLNIKSSKYESSPKFTTNQPVHFNQLHRIRKCIQLSTKILQIKKTLEKYALKCKFADFPFVLAAMHDRRQGKK